MKKLRIPGSGVVITALILLPEVRNYYLKPQTIYHVNLRQKGSRPFQYSNDEDLLH